MTLKPFAGFRSLETCHCVTGSMRHISRFPWMLRQRRDAVRASVPGAGFIYWHQRAPILSWVGVPTSNDPVRRAWKTASRRLGVKQSSFYTSSAGKAEKALLEMLEAGRPVMLQVDIGYLPYFNFGGEEYHFAITSSSPRDTYPEARQVLIPARDLELHPVSWNDLAKARSSACKPFPPGNRLYRYDFREFHSPEPATVILSIREQPPDAGAAHHQHRHQRHP